MITPEEESQVVGLVNSIFNRRLTSREFEELCIVLKRELAYK
jgi:hypothetical protein